jgi:hypothetical protein
MNKLLQQYTEFLNRLRAEQAQARGMFSSITAETEVDISSTTVCT